MSLRSLIIHAAKRIRVRGQVSGGPSDVVILMLFSMVFEGTPGYRNFDVIFYGFWRDLTPGTRGNRFPVSKSIDPPRRGFMGWTNPQPPPNHASIIPKSPSGPTQKLKKIISGSFSSLESKKNSASNELGWRDSNFFNFWVVRLVITSKSSLPRKNLAYDLGIWNESFFIAFAER